MRELRTHVEDRVEELQNAGLSEDEALRVILRRLDRPRVLARRYQDAHLAGTWHDAAMAAAAFLLVGVLYATHLWSQPVAVTAVAALIVSVTLYGLWQGRPPWFYAWAGLALTLLSFGGYFAFVLLERASDGGFDYVALMGFAGAALYVPLALAILASCIRVASRRDWLDASLMLSPSVPVIVWLAALHAGGGSLEAGSAVAGADAALAATFLAMAGTVAAFVRVRARPLRVATLVATALVLLVLVSTMSGSNASLTALTGRALLVFGFLLSPAVLEALAARSIGPFVPGE